MTDTKMTPKEFAPHLVAVLGRLTEFTPGKSVHHESTYAAVCQAFGVDEDALGTSSNGTTKGTHRQIGLAMRQLRDHGVTDYAKRGHWTLTTKGVAQARVDAGLEPLEDETPADDLAAARLDSTAEDIEETEPEGAEVVRLPVAGGRHPYNDDAYIRSLAVEGVGCFGAYSRRSDPCKSCPIQTDCVSAVSARKAEIAAELDAEDAAAAAAAQAQAQTKISKDATVDELIAKASGDGAKAKQSKGGGNGKYVPRSDQEVAPAFAQRETVCVQCDEVVPKDAPCTWVQDEGIFHNDCIEQGNQ